MIRWLQLTPDQRRATLTAATYHSGIQWKAIEKDWWVTLMLKAMFQGAYAQYIVFKGGTSLSKGWKLISRFSEDIDVALAPEAFGMQHEKDPSGNAVNRLRKKGFQFINNEFKADLEKQLRILELPEGEVSITARPIEKKQDDGRDPQSLHVKYKPLYDANAYLPDEVKIEVSVRSVLAPNEPRPIHSLLHEHNPNKAYHENPFYVASVHPRKTFMEKMFLLHEEFMKPNRTKVRSERMSRHLYDIGKIIGTDIETAALSDQELYDSLIQHRSQYHSYKGMDYSTMHRNSISFIPPEDIIEKYRLDYETMQKEMIYEKAIGFDDLIKRITKFQQRLRPVEKDKPDAIAN
jgi:hypothetical protein